MKFQLGLSRKTLLVLKLITIILLSCCLTASAHSYSQKITLKEKDAPLKKVLHEIELQSGFQFFFSDNDLKIAKTISIEKVNAELNEVLKECFKDQPLSYEIVDKTVVVKLKQEGATKNEPDAIPLADFHGRVTGENGEPLEGVTIQVKGTKNVAITDADGNFTFHDIDANAVISVSIVGYETNVIAIKGRTALGIQLKPKPQSLQDVVVSKGYYNVKQEYNTGSVVKVEGKDIQKQPVSDPIMALEGRVAGLDISQTSGLPGAYGTVRIRGQNTMTVGKPITATDPLYIVDGVPFSSQTLTSPYIGGGIIQAPAGTAGLSRYDAIGLGLSPFNSINPADIESVEVLKDADATAIYGSRGANGVILITTKKGRQGKMKADLSAYTGVSKVSRYYELMNTQQYLMMRMEGLTNDGYQYLLTNPQYKDYFPDLLIWDTTRYTDWQKVLIGKTAPFTNGNLDLSGGNSNTQYVIGAGYMSQGTTMPGDYIDRRVSLHLNINNASADRRFESSLSASYSNDNNRLPSTDPIMNITLPPDAPPIYDQNGNLNWAPYAGNATWSNPLAYTVTKAEAITDYYQGNLNLRYHLLKGLTISSSFGYSHSQMNQTIQSPATAAPPPNNTNPNSRSSGFSTSNNRSWIIEPQANYAREFGKSHLDVLVGTTFQSTSYDSRAFGAYGFASDALISNIQAATNVAVIGSTEAAYKYNSVYGRIGYILNEKYLINLTGRIDGSSRFGPDKQFGNFGSLGAGWIFSKEKWIVNNLRILSFGKLRASYGVTGSDAVGDYQFLSTYSLTGISYQNINGLKPTGLTNPDYRWEQTKKMGAGLDLGFLKERINIGIDWYRNRTDNQLVFSPLPALTGFNGVTSNLPALIQNEGWEFTLSTLNVKSKSFAWRMTGNVSINRNKLVSFPGIENTGYQFYYYVGYPLGTRAVFHFTGVDPQTGYYMYAAKNGNGRNPNANPITGDKIPSKPLTPDFYGGLENSISFKGFQLDFLIQFVKQLGFNYIYSFGNNAPGSISPQNWPAEILNRWQHPGEITNIQRLGVATGNTYYASLMRSDAMLTDASYVRLKNLALSYSFSGNWMKKAHLSTVRVYVQGQNLFTLTKYRGIDPESQGLTMPPMRTLTGGLQIGL